MDLGRLCAASGGGAEIEAEAIPCRDDAPAGRKDVTPLQAALFDGEDYELLFTLPARQATKVCDDPNLHLPITRIGRITKEPGLVLVQPDGKRQLLREGGWEHGGEKKS
jgi:thiamine-monophosphate kinase